MLLENNRQYARTEKRQVVYLVFQDFLLGADHYTLRIHACDLPTLNTFPNMQLRVIAGILYISGTNSEIFGSPFFTNLSRLHLYVSPRDRRLINITGDWIHRTKVVSPIVIYFYVPMCMIPFIETFPATTTGRFRFAFKWIEVFPKIAFPACIMHQHPRIAHPESMHLMDFGLPSCRPCADRDGVRYSKVSPYPLRFGLLRRF